MPIRCGRWTPATEGSDLPYLVSSVPCRTFSGFDEFVAEGDGNCLFHSLCFLLHRYGFGYYEPGALRAWVVDYIRWRYLPDALRQPWGFDSQYLDVTAYLKALATDRVYGDGNCIRAVAEGFQVLIAVHHDFGFPEMYPPGSSYPLGSLNLMYRGGNHYNPLFPPPVRTIPTSVTDVGTSGGELRFRPGVWVLRGDQVYPVQLQRSNLIDKEDCRCHVTAMSATPIDVPVYNLRGEKLRTEKRYFSIYAHLTKKTYLYVEAGELPPKARKRLLSEPFLDHRLDWFAGSSVKQGTLIGAQAPFFHHLLRFDEACYYASRALFDNGCAGVAGKIRTLAVPSGTTVILKPGMQKSHVTLQVYDGFGYIKRCLADKLEQTRIRRKVSVRPPNANYQMFHWLIARNQHDLEDEEAVAAELARGGVSKDESPFSSKQEVPTRVPTRQHLDEEWAETLLELDPELAHHPLFVEMLSRREVERLKVHVTTGDPPLATGVAMPVADSESPVVLPVTERLNDLTAERIAVFRYPGDTLNWVCPEAVDRTSDLAHFLGGMEAVQYSLTGRKGDGGPLTFYKGMLGVIDDDRWPDAWKEHALVVGHDDEKASELWTAETDVLKARANKIPNAFEFDGCLVAVSWFARGSCVGVSYPRVQKKLAGDYDGDMAVLLSGDRFPKTYEYIARKLEEHAKSVPNPKLPKLYTPKGVGDSRDACILKVWDGASLVGTWSNVAATLLAYDAETRDVVAKAVSREWSPSGDALLNRASYGYKEGTDAFKTKVDIAASFLDAKAIQDVLKEHGLRVPYVRMKREEQLFRDEDHLPRVQGDTDSLGTTPWEQDFTVRKEHCGIPSRLMRSTLKTSIPLQRPLSRALATFLDYVPPPEKDDALRITAIGSTCKNVILGWSPAERGTFQREWRRALGGIEEIRGLERAHVARLAWRALHDVTFLPDKWDAWKLAAGLFWEFTEEVEAIVRQRSEARVTLSLARSTPPSSNPSGSKEVEDDDTHGGQEEPMVDSGFFNDFDDDFDDDDLE